MNRKKMFVVAGEASGDTHAARLIRNVKVLAPDLDIEGLGGEKMREAGCSLRADLVSSAVMGFKEVIRNLGYFRKLLAQTRQYLRTNPPDVLLLVDYPGFNLRLAATAKKLGIPIVYYISPQIWAWRRRRIYRIAQMVDRMMVILPFEENLYKEANVDVLYVGHPLVDSISETEMDAEFLQKLNNSETTSFVGLLPGSRKQEVLAIFPALVKTARLLQERMPKTGFLIPCSCEDNADLVKRILENEGLQATVTLGKVYEVARVSRCCIVGSGTATLEVACLGTPLVVVYKTGHLAWFLGKRLLHVPHVSLVNILAGGEVVPEMLQYRMRPELLADIVTELCIDSERRRKMISDLEAVRQRLGSPGASARAAKAVWELLDQRHSAMAAPAT